MCLLNVEQDTSDVQQNVDCLSPCWSQWVKRASHRIGLFSLSSFVEEAEAVAATIGVRINWHPIVRMVPAGVFASRTASMMDMYAGIRVFFFFFFPSLFDLYFLKGLFNNYNQTNIQDMQKGGEGGCGLNAPLCRCANSSEITHAYFSVTKENTLTLSKTVVKT